MSARERCGGCESTDLRPFLDLGKTPLADTFPATPDETEQWYPLQVAVCGSCWLAQLLEVVPGESLYGADYGFRTGASPSAVAYFGEYAHWLTQRFDPGDGLVVEIACNDGTLMLPLQHHGWNMLGVEPVPGAAEEAWNRGLDVAPEPFGSRTAQRLAAGRGKASLIIANNVMAHVEDLNDFISGIDWLLAPDGSVVIEVQHLADLIAGNQIDHVYHEHRYFFTVETLQRMLLRYRLGIVSVEHTEAQGGSIRVVASRRFSRGPDTSASWLRQMATFESVQGRADHIRERLVRLVDTELAAGRRIAGYGAPAKSATLLNFCGLGPDKISHMVDLTRYKAGRYTPGTKIPILAPGAGLNPPDTYLVTVWNYLPRILYSEHVFHSGGGRFIVPIPYPVIL